MNYKIYCWLILLLSFATGVQGQTQDQPQKYTINRTINVQEALSYDEEYGILADAEGGFIKIKMYSSVHYKRIDVYGENQALLYSASATMNATAYQNESELIEYSDNLCYNPVLGTFQCEYYETYEMGSTAYKDRVLQVAKKLGKTSVSFYDQPTIEAIVILEISKNLSLSNLKEIKLPGLDQVLTPHDFVNYTGDFSSLFRKDGKITVAAHRGYWENAGVAQNSIAAIDAANAIAGSNWIELDIRSSKDKHPIIFHDDMPQKVLQDIRDDYPASSVYDLAWNTLKDYYLYDRFNEKSTETLLDLATVFKHIDDTGIEKPINMDIGIPDQVPQGEAKVDGKPFFDAVFLQAIGLACQYKLTRQIVFKGKYTYDHEIWDRVDSVLFKHGEYNDDGEFDVPRIAYTPKLGDDTENGDDYFNNWITAVQENLLPGVKVVGMEIRLKRNPKDANDPMTFLKNAMATAKQAELKVGVFSEAPTTCQGYWTKGAVEKYIDFELDRRNDFEWLDSVGYDYVITDFPKNLIAYNSKKEGGMQFSGFNATGMLFRKDVINNGFSIRFVANPSTTKNNKLIELIDEANKVYWRLGMDESGKIYVTRLIEDDGVESHWDVTFWEPENTAYAQQNADVFFALVQEKGQMRLMVGTPDGKFDCMYLDYGWENYWLNTNSINPDIFFAVNTAYVNNAITYTRPLCRTDMFHSAVSYYFNPEPLFDEAFSLLNHKNRFLDKSDFKNDSTTNRSDIIRLGSCEHYQNYFETPTMSQLSTYNRSIKEEYKPEVIPTRTVVFPNPSTGVVNIALGSEFEEDEQVEVMLYDLNGKIQKKTFFKVSAYQNGFLWNLDDQGMGVASGVYILAVRGKKARWNQRMILDCGCN